MGWVSFPVPAVSPVSGTLRFEVRSIHPRLRINIRHPSAILTARDELLRRARLRLSFTNVLRAAASGEAPRHCGGGVGELFSPPQRFLRYKGIGM